VANGKTHTMASMMIGAVGVAYLPFPDSAAWGMGAVLATILQPDLDQCEGAFGYYGFSVLRETKPILERMWSNYWRPYARLISHRAFISHFPVVGTLVRLMYLFPYAIFIRHYLPVEIVHFITVLIACDFLHWVMDWRVWGLMGLFKQ